jgi:hypothetical protein
VARTGARRALTVGAEDAVVLAAHSHAAGLVLVVPDRGVEDGTVIS